MKKTVTAVVSVLLICALALSLSGCGVKGEIRNAVAQFQSACNALDVEAALACLDPSVSGVLKLGAGLLGSLTGQNEEEVFGQLSNLLWQNADSFGVESFRTLKIKVGEIAANETSADAKVELTYVGLSGGETTTGATVTLNNTSEGWKISGFRFN